ncbi:MAG: Holliday junction resolvase RuvX [Anaerolineales bacterium]|nr:Holliday junction resolvase RuvX [Anaerolineales bacterium]
MKDEGVSLRYLGLDIGNKRVGVAVGNSDARIASPLAVIERTTLDHDAAQLMDLAREYEVEMVIVGLPRNADNTASEQEALTRAYAQQLQSSTGLPFRFQDERYSTAAALRQQQERGVNAKRGRATLDAAAAAVILQDFLDALEIGN